MSLYNSTLRHCIATVQHIGGADIHRFTNCMQLHSHVFFVAVDRLLICQRSVTVIPLCNLSLECISLVRCKLYKAIARTIVYVYLGIQLKSLRDGKRIISAINFHEILRQVGQTLGDNTANAVI